MTMEPEHFKQIAGYLEKLSNTTENETNHDLSEEAIIRTVVSRYYYYIFLKIREEILDAINTIKNPNNANNATENYYLNDLDQLKIKLTPPIYYQKNRDRENVHQIIQRFVREFAGNEVADALFRLREYRNLADYYIKTPAKKEIREDVWLTTKFTSEELEELIKKDLEVVENWLKGNEKTRYPIHKALRSKDASKKIIRVI